MANGTLKVGVRILLAAGISGLAAEVAWIRFGILSRFAGSYAWDRALGEIALTIVVYGLVFGLAVVANRHPAFALTPPPQPLAPWQRWVRDHRAGIYVSSFALFSISILMPLYFLATGLFTASETISQLLHLYPILGLMVAAFAFAREARTGRFVSDAG